MGCDSSKQTFCSLNRQSVSQNSDIVFKYENELFNKSESQLTLAEKEQIQGTTITTKEVNNIIDALTKIKNFGAYGTRNPSEAEMKKLAKALQYEGINADTYDQIIKILDSNNTVQHQYTLIKGTYLSQIREKINNYKLNDDRCDTCNTSCNAGCQVSSQAPPCDSCQPGCNTSCESYVCGQSGTGCTSGESGGRCSSFECSDRMCSFGKA